MAPAIRFHQRFGFGRWWRPRRKVEFPLSQVSIKQNKTPTKITCRTQIPKAQIQKNNNNNKGEYRVVECYLELVIHGGFGLRSRGKLRSLNPYFMYRSWERIVTSTLQAGGVEEKETLQREEIGKRRRLPGEERLLCVWQESGTVIKKKRGGCGGEGIKRVNKINWTNWVWFLN